jgi:rRNA maturation RNase YbeY
MRMMMKVTCSWQLRRKKAILNNKAFKEIIVKIAHLAKLNLTPEETISVNFIGPRTMCRINRDFLNHNYLTDVICFNNKNESDFSDDDIAVEIFISPDIAEERASENPELKYESELILYLVHGILHAAGFKDKTDEEKKIMRQNENRILNKLNLPFS